MTETVYARIKPHFPGEWKGKVERITKLWIVVRYNEIATGKFSRKTGYESGAFNGREITPSKVVNLSKLNKLADDNGGLWDSKKDGA